MRTPTQAELEKRSNKIPVIKTDDYDLELREGAAEQSSEATNQIVTPDETAGRLDQPTSFEETVIEGKPQTGKTYLEEPKTFASPKANLMGHIFEGATRVTDVSSYNKVKKVREKVGSEALEEQRKKTG